MPPSLPPSFDFLFLPLSPPLPFLSAASNVTSRIAAPAAAAGAADAHVLAADALLLARILQVTKPSLIEQDTRVAFVREI